MRRFDSGLEPVDERLCLFHAPELDRIVVQHRQPIWAANSLLDCENRAQISSRVFTSIRGEPRTLRRIRISFGDMIMTFLLINAAYLAAHR